MTAVAGPVAGDRRGAVTWVAVCALAALQPERGVAALIEGVPVAVFRTHDGALYALDNVDPCSGASVLSRGIVGSRAGSPTVASPMHKQAFDLRTGECLDQPDRSVRTFPVRCRDGLVEVGMPGSAGHTDVGASAGKGAVGGQG